MNGNGCSKRRAEVAAAKPKGYWRHQLASTVLKVRLEHAVLVDRKEVFEPRNELGEWGKGIGLTPEGEWEWQSACIEVVHLLYEILDRYAVVLSAAYSTVQYSTAAGSAHSSARAFLQASFPPRMLCSGCAVQWRSSELASRAHPLQASTDTSSCAACGVAQRGQSGHFNEERASACPPKQGKLPTRLVSALVAE